MQASNFVGHVSPLAEITNVAKCIFFLIEIFTKGSYSFSSINFERKFGFSCVKILCLFLQAFAVQSTAAKLSSLNFLL